MKTCSRCGSVKDYTEFGPRKRSLDGYHIWCRKCDNEYKRNWAKTNLEKRRVSCQKWLDKNPDWSKQRVAKLRLAAGSKIKEGARAKTRWQKLQGAIDTSICQKCSALCKGRIEIHHNDYTNPEDILVLCQEHHRAWHRVFLADC